MKHVEMNNAGVVITVRSDPYPPKKPITIPAPNNVECGWIKQGDQWIEPAEAVADRSRKRWTAYQFLKRLTREERKAIKVKARTDVLVADFELLATAAQEIVSDDPETVAGMDYLVSVGVLTEARKNEILSGV